MRDRLWSLFILLGAFLVACAPSGNGNTMQEATPLVLLEKASPTLPPSPSIEPSPSPTLPLSPTSAATPTPPEQPQQACRLVADADTTVYMRPSTEADVFGMLTAGESVEPQVRTADGWLGFDPGVAQAGNRGVFRYRWIRPGSTAHTEGACDALPTVWAPKAGICYLIPFDETPVYAEPREDAPLLTVLSPEAETFVAVLALNADGTWAQVDLAEGTANMQGSGWVEGDMLNLNGPCETLPSR